MPVRKNAPVPYAPPAAVLQVIDRYRNHGLDTPFDKDVLARAGVTDSLIPRTLQALTILDFVDDGGKPAEILEKLAEAPSEQFSDILAEAVRAAYADVFSFTNPAADSYDTVRDAFRRYQPRGQQSRMVTLFLGLCERAGIISEMPPKGPRKPAAARKTTPDRAPENETRIKSVRSFNPDFGKIRARQPARSMNPAISGLLHTLPTRWTTDERDAFLATFRAVLDYAIPISVNVNVDDESGDE